MGSTFARRILIGALAAGALVAVGIAYAGVPDSGGVVHLCYQVDRSGDVTANSSVRVIDPSLTARARSSCGHDEGPRREPARADETERVDGTDWVHGTDGGP